jgi:hypothetical protein
MKTFFEIDNNDDELYNRKKEYLNNFVVNFYDKIKDKPNVLSRDYLISRRSKLFSTTIWDNKIFLIGNNIIFGLKSGICFEQSEYLFEIHIAYGTGIGDSWSLFPDSEKKEIKYVGNSIVWFNYYSEAKKKSTAEDIEVLKDFFNELNSLAEKFDNDILKEIEEKKNKDKKDKQELKITKESILQELDKDSNGEIDLIENDFNKLLSKYQKQVIVIDKNYIHQFVKVSNYIKTKKSNIQKIFESIEKTSSKEELDERLNLLKNQIHTYELLVFHSINMISALISEDLITFYEIYESFDKIGIYNSNWENEVSDKLSTIGSKLDDLLFSIYEMENRIVSEIGYLNYVTQESFSDLNNSVTANLKSINSSIDVNNLFTAINTYQLYKINKQTKPLLPK